MPDAIVMKGVTKTFGQKLAVNGFDLVVPEGRLYGFIGPNGAGKTTTIRMVMSIIFPDRGDISVLGKASAIESKDRIGYLPEERGLYRKMKVGAFLAYMARLKGVDAAGLDGRVKDWLARVELADVYRKKCQELSKGMQQKIQFLSAIMHGPELVILDEPFSGLDPVNARLMRELVDDLHTKGATIIFSTHVMQHAEQICDHVVMMDRGTKVLDASLGDIRSRFDPKTVTLEPMRPGDDLGALRALPFVRGISGHADDPARDVRLDDRVDPVEAIRALAAAAPLRRIELKRASLEDIFIDLVRSNARTGAGAPGDDPHDEQALRDSLRARPGAEAPGGFDAQAARGGSSRG